MKKKGGGSSKLQHVYWSLLACFIVLALVFIGGTVYGLFFHAGNTAAPASPRADTPQPNEGDQIFTGIGRLRASTADPQPGTVILFVTFKYDPGDKAFSEELALRVKDFRDIVVKYIGSLSSAELQKTGEDKIKDELMRRFNSILRLGQIKNLYFSDFMIVG